MTSDDKGLGSDWLVAEVRVVNEATGVEVGAYDLDCWLGKDDINDARLELA